jgi:activator of HSP90 ATPase
MTSKVYVAIRVPGTPAEVFDVFTQEIALWWQPSGLFQITPQGDGRLTFEPGMHGRLFATVPEGREFEIGRITVWEPGKRLVFGWRQSSFLPGMATEVEVTFEAVGDETRVSVEHRGWDTVPEEHVARHRFPEPAFLQRAAEWWRTSLAALRARAELGGR